MKKVFLFMLLFALALSAIAQSEIHLAGKDSVIYASKVFYKNCVVTYLPIGKKQHYQSITWNKVDYICKGNKNYGLSKHKLIKVKKTLMEPEASRKGALDACRNYTKYRLAQNGTFLTTFAVGGIIGLIPAIATSSTPPMDKNLNIPDTPLKQDQAYINAYKQQAENMKRGAAWDGYGSGIVAATVFLITYGALSY